LISFFVLRPSSFVKIKESAARLYSRMTRDEGRSPDWSVIEVHTVTREVKFPYIPGLLSIREVPAQLDAFAQLVQTPDVVMLDGEGIAHPRRFGLACHLGLWLDVPSLGCAKSWLIGDHDEPGHLAGDSTPLTIVDEAVGTVMRSAANANLCIARTFIG
jgi:deoxyribonuclease V